MLGSKLFSPDPVGRAAGAGVPSRSAGGAAPPVVERRGAARADARVTALVTRHAHAHNPARRVGIHDASATGISFILDGAVLAPGEQFVLQVTGGDSHWPLDGGECLCMVRSVRARRDGRLRIGAEFCAPGDLAPADHVAAVRSTVGGSVRLGDGWASPADRRLEWHGTAGGRPRPAGKHSQRAERVALRELAPMYVCHADGGESPVERVEILDYSATGAALTRREPLAGGEQLVLRVPREGERPLTRLCDVTRVGRVDGRFVIGVRFIPFGRRRGRRLLARIVDWIV